MRGHQLSELLNGAVLRNQNRSLTDAEIIAELVALANELRAEISDLPNSGSRTLKLRSTTPWSRTTALSGVGRRDAPGQSRVSA